MLSPGPPGAGDAAAAFAAGLPQGGRVLIVEDDRGLQEIYADILLDDGLRRGRRVGRCGGAARARGRRLRRRAVRCRHARRHRRRRAAGVRERDLDVPVVLVTGSPSVETAVQAVEMGALHYLLKPVARAELVEAIEHAARLRKLAAVKREALRYLGRDRRADRRPRRPRGGVRPRSRLRSSCPTSRSCGRATGPCSPGKRCFGRASRRSPGRSRSSRWRRGSGGCASWAGRSAPASRARRSRHRA